MNKQLRGKPDRCYYCGEKEQCTKDHFWPKSKGGKLQVYACITCQILKKDYTPEEFIMRLESGDIRAGHSVKIAYKVTTAYIERVVYTIKSLNEYILKNNIPYKSNKITTKTHSAKPRLGVLGVWGMCYYCSSEGAVTQDHFYPKSQDGKQTVWCCRNCQKLKGHKTPTQWVSVIEQKFPPSQVEAARQKVKNLIIYMTQNDLK